MAIVNRTNTVVPASMVTLRAMPVVAGNCLRLQNLGDMLGPINFAWPQRYTIFYRAKAVTLGGSNRLIVSDLQQVILSLTGILVGHNGVQTATSPVVTVVEEVHDHAFSFDGNFIYFFRDGRPVGAAAPTTQPVSTSVPTYFFNRSDGQRNCDMQISRFKFYSRYFDQKRIMEHYRARNNDYRNLELKYDLEEGTGTVAHDTSGKGRDTNIVGCSWETYSAPTLKNPFP